MAVDSGLMQKASFQLMSAHTGGRTNLGYIPLDAKNYLRARRQRSMVYGEIGSLMEYFQTQLLENPSFIHAYQMDCDEQVTNVFWADAKMILDYGYFGEAVIFFLFRMQIMHDTVIYFSLFLSVCSH